MSVIHLDVDEAFANLLGDSAEEIGRTALESIVLDLDRRHEVSAGRAAELLKLEEFAFIRWSGLLGIPYMDATPEELRQDLLTFIRWSGERGVPYIDMTPEEWQEELRTLDKMGRADPSS